MEATMEVNGYQRAKAVKIADYLTTTREYTTLTPHQLCRCVALLNMDQWRAVAFAAGQPLADLDCKAEVLRILRERV
jgi:hypothetical protein